MTTVTKLICMNPFSAFDLVLLMLEHETQNAEVLGSFRLQNKENNICHTFFFVLEVIKDKTTSSTLFQSVRLHL